MPSNSPIHESNVLVFNQHESVLCGCACTPRHARYNTTPTQITPKSKEICVCVYPCTPPQHNNTPTCSQTRTRSFVRTYEQIPFYLSLNEPCSFLSTRAPARVHLLNCLTKQTRGLGLWAHNQLRGDIPLEPLKDLLLVEWVK